MDELFEFTFPAWDPSADPWDKYQRIAHIEFENALEEHRGSRICDQNMTQVWKVWLATSKPETNRCAIFENEQDARDFIKLKAIQIDGFTLDVAMVPKDSLL